MWKSGSNRCSSSSNSDTSLDFNHLDDVDEDAVDPRVQEELEKLNNSTDAINKLEVDLDDARSAFRQLLIESTQRLNSLAKKLGSCVEKSRPYYDAKVQEKKAHSETQKAALRFERANSALAIAKEMVFSAEERLQNDRCTFDPAWQEMLNHATIRVNEAERERNSSELEHKKTSKIYNDSDQSVKALKKELRSNIAKASLSARRNLLQLNDLAHQHQLLLLPYFEMKAQFNKKMEEKKRQVQELEENVLKAKVTYAEALHNLEEISDEIHQKRKACEERRALGTRGTGVGAENPEPANNWENCMKMNGNYTESELNKEFYQFPIRPQIPKSHSSSTLSRMEKLQETGLEDEESGEKLESKYISRLRKSKSVMERTRAGPLFGKYSVSRNSKLQVDHSCQTEEISYNEEQMIVLNLHKLPEIMNFKENLLNIPDSTTPTPRSEVSSPVFTGSNKSEPLSNGLSTPKHNEDYDPSDSESQFSGDGLSDDQIASLMLDMELEKAALNIGPMKITENKSVDGHFMQNQTTQTCNL